MEITCVCEYCGKEFDGQNAFSECADHERNCAVSEQANKYREEDKYSIIQSVKSLCEQIDIFNDTYNTDLIAELEKDLEDKDSTEEDDDCDCIDCENCPRDCKVEKDPTVEFSFDGETAKMSLDEMVDSICDMLFGKVNSDTDKDKEYYSVNGKEVSEKDYEKAKSEFDKKWKNWNWKKDFSIDSVLDKLYKD